VLFLPCRQGGHPGQSARRGQGGHQGSGETGEQGYNKATLHFVRIADVYDRSLRLEGNGQFHNCQS